MKSKIVHILALLVGLALHMPARAAAYDDSINAVRLGDAPALEALLNQGLLPDTVDPHGNSLLILAAREGKLEVVDLLIRKRAKVGYRNPAGDSALSVAALQGFKPIVDRLLAAGAPIGNEGWSPLIYAAFGGHLDIVKTLVERGAIIDQLAPNKASALMFAARNGHIEVVRYLLDKGADPTLVNDQQRTARSWALEKGNTDIAALIDHALAARGIKPKPLRLQIE